MNQQSNQPAGLTSGQARERQEQFGKNELVQEKKQSVFRVLCAALGEPMFILLLAAAGIYFVLGEQRDGTVMLLSVVVVICIQVFQEWKTDKTLRALKKLSAPRITVLRDGVEQVIDSADLVPGDVMFVAEGVKIPADGVIVKASTLRVDESSLTGEPEGVWKAETGSAPADQSGYWRQDYCYAGTLVTQGSGTVVVDRIGAATEYGKIGRAVLATAEEPTPLQRQTGRLVKLCAAIAAVLFLLVAMVTYLNIPDHEPDARLVESVLAGITLAMAMIPEEFPVILTVFLSMGAWRLAQKNSLIRSLSSVETLGAVSVLCVDKTGTITMNRMMVETVWSLAADPGKLIETMGLACEPDAYDPMERAMLACCEDHGFGREMLFSGKLIKEYAFTHETKMMGHVWERDGRILLAAKGSPERILAACKLEASERQQVEQRIGEMSGSGLRVIAVGEQAVADARLLPADLAECCLEFCGLIGLSDPPRESIEQDIATCTRAGVRVVMITGDNGITARAIARQIQMPHSDRILTGDELDKLSEEELRDQVKDISIFSRVLPEHKLRIVKAFKANGEIVAMTGDGVNDAPALKHADIGIAMGQRGSEVSREAADMILLDDNFSTIVDTIRDGRRIYDNIRKAVGYVCTIHVPIALAALVAPVMGVAPANLLLLPLHVILLELVIDPTCSIVLERQAAERNIMDRPPRNHRERLITITQFGKNILQGLAIFGAAFGLYSVFLVQYPDNASLARSMGITVILLANVLLVHVISSDTEFAVQSLYRHRHEAVMQAVHIGTIGILAAMLYTPLNSWLKLAPLSLSQLLLAAGVAGAAVLWYEFVKAARIFRWAGGR